MSGEIWKDIIGYEGLYQVSNEGRVKSFKQDVHGKILTPTSYRSGYRVVQLSHKGKLSPYKIHELVAKAFIPNPNNYSEVNHKDDVSSNNHVSNLEWATVSYFDRLKTKNKYARKGEGAPVRKLTNEQVIQIYDFCWNSELSVVKIANMLGISKGAVDSIKYGRTWEHVTNHQKEGSNV